MNKKIENKIIKILKEKGYKHPYKKEMDFDNIGVFSESIIFKEYTILIQVHNDITPFDFYLTKDTPSLFSIYVNEKLLNLYTKVILNNNCVLKGVFTHKDYIYNTCKRYNVKIKLLNIESIHVILYGKPTIQDVYYCEIDYSNLKIQYLKGFVYHIINQSLKIDTKEVSDYQKKLSNV